MDLTDRLALVTGGTRGLGLAIAGRLCSLGCEVLVNYAHDDAGAEEALEALGAAGGKASLVRADVADPDQVRAMLDDIERDRGRLDIFVHNAGIHRPAPATAISREAYDRITALVVGPLVSGAGHLARLLPAGTGRVVAVSSTGARRAVPDYAALGSAKAALESLVRYLAVELAGRGITVNAVRAGKLDKDPGSAPSGPAARVAARTPAGRLTRPGDVADVVAMLCRAEAGWIHGETITVDGGLHLMT
ncbi:SDR family oxidoreductase [Actinomadura harenae]|uniref:SDR family oxidoreductase n=1 Tax=Actinomadura harenae TaxID=2483351 RepID=A0A3M2M107_9ACTN|nr:SDR family oxidoreductase [Actinomadura harenae]